MVYYSVVVQEQPLCQTITTTIAMVKWKFLTFLGVQNSQHFNEDLLVVNAYAFSFVLCFKAINHPFALSANGTALENS